MGIRLFRHLNNAVFSLRFSAKGLRDKKMLASIFGTATRPLSTPEQVEKVVSDISAFMDEQSFNTAVDVFSSLRPPEA